MMRRQNKNSKHESAPEEMEIDTTRSTGMRDKSLAGRCESDNEEGDDVHMTKPNEE